MQIETYAFPLFYLSSFTGLVMVVGSIWLIYKEKIYIDSETKQVTEIQTPLGTFKTNIPAILLFVLGFFFLGFPILKVTEIMHELATTVDITGTVDSNEEPVIAYAVLAEQTLYRAKEFRLTVPSPRPGLRGYTVLVRSGPMTDVHNVTIKGGDRSARTETFQFMKPPDSDQGEVTADFEPDTVDTPGMFRK